MLRNDYYVYIFLDPRKKGIFRYEEFSFDYEPFYIGKGKLNRINVHLQKESLTIKSPRIQKISKIFKLNLEPIKFKLHENLTEKEAFELEIKLIALIGRKDLKLGPLTNLTNGGDGTSGVISKKRKAIYQINPLTNEIILYNSITDICNVLNYDRGAIINCCSGRKKQYNGFLWKYVDETREMYNGEKTEIIKLDLYGNFIQEFESVHIAALDSGDLTNYDKIIRCCKGLVNHINNFNYAFKDSKQYEKYRNIKNNYVVFEHKETIKGIKAISPDKNIILFRSVKETCKKLNITRGSLKILILEGTAKSRKFKNWDFSYTNEEKEFKIKVTYNNQEKYYGSVSHVAKELNTSYMHIRDILSRLETFGNPQKGKFKDYKFEKIYK